MYLSIVGMNVLQAKPIGMAGTGSVNKNYILINVFEDQHNLKQKLILAVVPIIFIRRFLSANKAMYFSMRRILTIACD